jgi:predicted Zn-dependent protease
VLNNFLNYCISQKRVDCLQNQISQLEQTTSRPEIREYLPVFKGMAAFLQNDHLDAEKHLKELTTDNPELQYHAAYILGSMDRIKPAIQLYRKIPKDHSKYSLACLNLSELLTLSGEEAEALAIAKNIWETASDWPAARECYGVRLLETGHPENAAEILDPLVVNQNATERVRENWRNAMRQILEKQFAAKQLENAQKTARRILLYWDKDPVASSYSIHIQNAILEQEKAEREANQQN